MNRFKFLVVLAVAGICFTVIAPKTEAQISINIGVPPDVLTVTMTTLLMNVLPTATTARNGLPMACSLAPARGSMAMPSSRAT